VPLFFRLTYHNPADADDLRSQAELGKVRPRSLSEEDWAGVSIFDSAQAAADQRQRTYEATGRNLGDFIAELDIPAGVEVRQQGSDRHHYVVWQPAQQLLGYVTHTAPVLPLEPPAVEEDDD
jgi:hypothetical protein